MTFDNCKNLEKGRHTSHAKVFAFFQSKDQSFKKTLKIYRYAANSKTYP